jgi:hypothetical protein
MDAIVSVAALAAEPHAVLAILNENFWCVDVSLAVRRHLAVALRHEQRLKLR